MDTMEESENMIWTTRFVIQKILVPIVVIFGIVGNSISILVLTRSWMRCSTNYYLTALAVYDTLYLIFAMIMSLSHYTIVKDKTWYVFYQYPIGKPLVDTFSNTAVWLTITFTIERWICVCLPIRGRVWCTPKRAKHVIIAVCIAAAIITFPEFFEYIIVLDPETQERKLSTAEYPSNATTNPFLPSKSENQSVTNASAVSDYLHRTRFQLQEPQTYFRNRKAEDVVEDNLDLVTEETRDQWILQNSKMADSAAYQMGYVLLCQILFTFLPLIILLIFNR